MLAFHDFTEAADGLLERNILALDAGKLLADSKRLRQEALNLTRTGYGELIVLGQLVHTHDCNDVLQLLIALQHALYLTRYIVVLLTQNFRRQNPAGRLQRVYCRINAL